MVDQNSRFTEVVFTQKPEKWPKSKKMNDRQFKKNQLLKVSCECEKGNIITTSTNTYAAITCAKREYDRGVDSGVGFSVSWNDGVNRVSAVESE